MLYEPRTLRLHVNDDVLEVDELPGFLSHCHRRSVLIETTSLNFPEMLFACRAALEIGVSRLGFIYAEPGEYSGSHDQDEMQRREFQLSDEVVGYQAIPGAAVVLDETRSQKSVFFLGYEGERLDQAFENLNLNADRCSVVFGVPAFKPGWEMNSFANNARVLRERGVGGGVSFCAANSPTSAIRLLEHCLGECSDASDLVVSPIGTKPHGIATALFASVHQTIGVAYDHPRKKEGRSRRIHRWHFFELMQMRDTER
jgi:hypothetical protein